MPYFVVTSVSVFLPPSLPEAVLIKALSVRGSTWEDWWSDLVAICSLEATLTQSDSATKLTLSSVGAYYAPTDILVTSCIC